MQSDNYVPTKDIGNGVTVNFTYTWDILAQAYIRVYLENVSTGVQVLQTLGSDYTLVYDESGGTVTFTTPPPATEYVIISRDIPLDQSVNYKTSKGFDGEVIENSFDKNTAQNQNVQEGIDRTLKVPVGSTVDPTMPVPSADKYITWNTAADGFENKSAPTVVSYSGYFDVGADASKPASPAVGDLYFASDTNIFYRCIVSGTWSSNAVFGQVKTAKGADVASVAALTLGDDGNAFDITGTNNITSITAKTAGTMVVLQFDGILTLTNGSNLSLNGDFVTKSGSVIFLACDGIDWVEVARQGKQATLELNLGTSINEISIDGTLAGNSDDAVPTEKAAKEYVDKYTQLGAWLSRSNNTTYQASTDGFVLAQSSSGAAESIDGLTDGSTPPTTSRTASSGIDSGERVNLMMPVKSGDYWKVTGCNVVWWIPVGV